MKQLQSDTYPATLAGRLLKRLPPEMNKLQAQVKQQAGQLERRLLKNLKQRLDQVDDAAAKPLSVMAFALQTQARHAKKTDPKRLAGQMHDLLTASSEHNHADAQTAFFASIMDQLLPDQARILSALSDGSTYPLLHVFAGKKIGIAVEPVIECVSSVGRSAGVLYLEATHVYVSQLRSWGLVQIGIEDTSREVQYEILETETLVRKTIEDLQAGGLRTQIIRRSLQMSELGHALWAATRVGSDEE